MNIDRRNLLFAAAALASTSQYAEGHTPKKRVSQAELNEAIRLHSVWLADLDGGRRCRFAGRDLSGLQFGVLGGPAVDLNGADFAQADLSATEADAILIHHCSFNGATFDRCHWRQPVFAFADIRRASAKRVIWGTPGRRGSKKRSPGDFSHAILHDADLTEARICGHFYGAKLVRASLVRAVLSLSDFLGYEMSFSQANLSGAQLRHCHISSASFSNADCSGVDFSCSVFSEVRIKNCNLTGANLRGAEFERPVFSPYQVLDTELQRTMTGV
jgi:uncharacterized protein YjbI with pentapeptide repeats